MREPANVFRVITITGERKGRRVVVTRIRRFGVYERLRRIVLDVELETRRGLIVVTRRVACPHPHGVGTVAQTVEPFRGSAGLPCGIIHAALESGPAIVGGESEGDGIGGVSGLALLIRKKLRTEQTQGVRGSGIRAGRHVGAEVGIRFRIECFTIDLQVGRRSPHVTPSGSAPTVGPGAGSGPQVGRARAVVARIAQVDLQEHGGLHG